MRVLAAILVAAVAVLPLIGCGGGSGGFSCSGQCGFCNSSFDCCDSSAGCFPFNDGTSRCSTFTPFSC